MSKLIIFSILLGMSVLVLTHAKGPDKKELSSTIQAVKGKSDPTSYYYQRHHYRPARNHYGRGRRYGYRSYGGKRYYGFYRGDESEDESDAMYYNGGRGRNHHRHHYGRGRHHYGSGRRYGKGRHYGHRSYGGKRYYGFYRGDESEDESDAMYYNGGRGRNHHRHHYGRGRHHYGSGRRYGKGRHYGHRSYGGKRYYGFYRGDESEDESDAMYYNGGRGRNHHRHHYGRGRHHYGSGRRYGKGRHYGHRSYGGKRYYGFYRGDESEDESDAMYYNGGRGRNHHKHHYGRGRHHYGSGRRYGKGRHYGHRSYGGKRYYGFYRGDESEDESDAMYYNGGRGRNHHRHHYGRGRHHYGSGRRYGKGRHYGHRSYGGKRYYGFYRGDESEDESDAMYYNGGRGRNHHRHHYGRGRHHYGSGRRYGKGRHYGHRSYGGKRYYGFYRGDESEDESDAMYYFGRRGPNNHRHQYR